MKNDNEKGKGRSWKLVVVVDDESSHASEL